jgi:hypothetical protein
MLLMAALAVIWNLLGQMKEAPTEAASKSHVARFVRYVGGCRPGDDSHRLIWEAIFS